jgi:photosystem II stability/assembly factor-like uncharacterized protein
MRKRRARLSLITIAALAVVVPGAAAGLAEHSSGLSAGGGPGTSYSVTREADGSYSATLATGDRVHAKIPSELPGAKKGTAEAVPRARVGSQRRPESNPWRLQATLPGTVIKDISFASPTVGYVAAELGKVWKTTDGGNTWTPIMNLGYPYYWYGVDALSENDVVISGFDNSNWRGLLRWSHDGGQTWSSDVVLTTRGWSVRARFADDQHGLVLDLINLDGPSVAHYTTNGGQTAADWATVVLDPDGGWFGNQFSFLPSLEARASGITYCASPDGGASWNCRPSVDEVFDGPTFFYDHQFGWVGGGSISPTVEGWVHRTADGGETWSGRTLEAPWPIREIRFVTSQLGWAAGGNIYSGVGGLDFSGDGGQTWSLDLNSGGAELDACDHWGPGPGHPSLQVWCAGYDGAFAGKVYTLKLSASSG